VTLCLAWPGSVRTASYIYGATTNRQSYAAVTDIAACRSCFVMQSVAHLHGDFTQCSATACVYRFDFHHEEFGHLLARVGQ
jgi:hypothetical protein